MHLKNGVIVEILCHIAHFADLGNAINNAQEIRWKAAEAHTQ